MIDIKVSLHTGISCPCGIPYLYPGNPIYGPLVCINRCPSNYQCLQSAETPAVRVCCDPTKPSIGTGGTRQNVCWNGYPPIQDTCVPTCPVASSCFLVGSSFKCCVNETLGRSSQALFIMAKNTTTVSLVKSTSSRQY